MSNDKFNQVIDDFVKDLLVTFPELKDKLTDVNKEAFLAHCSESYPKIFFELLYENEKLFEEPCFLLPDIDFTILMNFHKNIHQAQPNCRQPRSFTCLSEIIQLLANFSVISKKFLDNYLMN